MRCIAAGWCREADGRAAWTSAQPVEVENGLQEDVHVIKLCHVISERRG